mmetsp:Transcript_8215/g.24283  ORF Transcript_8215/g.24283 Transcript_8215/m.24283 type:complete len:97 (+) Transcript_8215:422-712(+)
MRGLSRRSTMILRPLVSSARSMAWKIGYEYASCRTQSRNRYLPKRKEQIEPMEAPTKTHAEARAILQAIASTDDPMAKPAPKDSSEPGTKQIVATT